MKEKIRVSFFWGYFFKIFKNIFLTAHNLLNFKMFIRLQSTRYKPKLMD